MSNPLWKSQAFSISHADGSGTTESHFEGGLRAFFEYRDLGIAAATGGFMWPMSSVRSPAVMRNRPGMFMIWIFRWSIFCKAGWCLNMKDKVR